MNLKITRTAPGKPIRGGQITPINVTVDDCCPTITTRIEAAGWTQFIELGHYPSGAVLIEFIP